MSNRRDIAELEPAELETLLSGSGCEPFHARQVFRWVYRFGVTDFGRMTDLSRTLRARLQDEFVINTPRIISDETSSDGTRKLVLEYRAEGARLVSDEPLHRTFRRSARLLSKLAQPRSRRADAAR